MVLGLALLTLFPGRIGGSESNVRGILGEFGRGSGPERVDVLANDLVMRAYAGLEQGSVRLVPIPAYRRGERSLSRLAAMAAAGAFPRRIARAVPDGIDVLHHAVTVPIPRLDVPTVTTIFDVQHHDLPQFFSRGERAYRRVAYDRAARHADVVLTSSEYSRRRLCESVGVEPGRVLVAPLGIDHARFSAQRTKADENLRERLSLPDCYIAYPANLWPHKNHRRLVEGLALARDRELHLVLTGQTFGRYEELLGHAQRAGVEQRLHHAGYLQPADLPALLRAAAGVVFPSLYEGFGSPPLEAMACGCPVASSTRASLAEVVREAALELDPTSPESIGRAIDELVSDSKGAELRAAGFANAARFTWERTAALHLEAYERALRTRRASR